MATDMLVRLYDLPDHRPLLASLNDQGVTIRPAISPEMHLVLAWAKEHFGLGWVDQIQTGFYRQPVSTIIAVQDKSILGFACYDCTYRNFFGPTGVVPNQRGRGLGKALLLACLHAMKEQGYGYAIIGSAGPQDFYAKACDAISIPKSDPGIYAGILRELQAPLPLNAQP